MNISELMRDLADEAPELNVADAALRAAHRRRPRAALAAVAAVLAVLAVAGTATLLATRVGRHPAPPPAGVAAPRLPAALVVPATLEPLPDARPVGRGVLLYQEALDMVLVTAGGRQYQLPRAGGACDSLSPDGRWLSYGSPNTAGACALRDLTSTTRRGGTGMPSAWSANGRWLLVAPTYLTTAASRSQGVQYQLLDLATGRQRAVPAPATGGMPVAVDAAGRPVVTWRTGDAAPYAWHAGTLDPATGRMVHQSVLALAPPEPPSAGQPPEVGSLATQLAVDSDELFTREPVERAVTGGSVQVPGDLVVLDLSSGGVRQRYRLGSRAEEANLSVAAAYPGTALLLHRGTAGSVDAIYAFDLRTGIRHRATAVPAAVRWVSLPGQIDRLYTV